MFLAYLILTPTPLHGHTLLIFTNCSMKDKQNEQNPSDRTASKTSEEFPRSEENTYSSWPQWTLDKAGLLKIQLSNPYDASYSKRNSSERNSKERNSRERNFRGRNTKEMKSRERNTKERKSRENNSKERNSREINFSERNTRVKKSRERNPQILNIRKGNQCRGTLGKKLQGKEL